MLELEDEVPQGQIVSYDVELQGHVFPNERTMTNVAPQVQYAAQPQVTNAAPTNATAHNTEAWDAAQHANAEAEYAAQWQVVPGDQEQVVQDAAPQVEHTQYAAQQHVVQGDQEQVVPDAPPQVQYAAQQQVTNADPTTETAPTAAQHANAEAEYAAQQQVVQGDQEQVIQDAAPQGEHAQYAAQQHEVQGDQEQVVPDAPPQVQYAAQQQVTNADPTTETAPTEAWHAAQHANAEAEYTAQQQVVQGDQEQVIQEAAPQVEHAQYAAQQQVVQGDQEQLVPDAPPQVQYDAQQQVTNATEARNATRHAAAEAEYAAHQQVVQGDQEQVFQDAAPQVELAQFAAQQQVVQGDQEHVVRDAHPQVQYAAQQVTNAAPTTCDVPKDSEGYDIINGWSSSSSSSTSDVDSDAFEEQVVQYFAAHRQMTHAAPTSFAAPTRELELMTDLDRIAHGLIVQYAAQRQGTHAAPTTFAAPIPELTTDLDRIALSWSAAPVRRSAAGDLSE